MQYRILVIDDMKSIYNAVNQVLEPRGCIVEYAESGSQGLQQLNTVDYDLVILDIHLPDRNGLWICKKIKKLKTYENRPVILLTSDTRNLNEGLMVGASDYIIKPFNKFELVARVFTQISFSKARLTFLAEKKHLEENLREKEVKLLEARRELQHFFYQTAHRLRSPIYSIKGLFNLLGMESPGTLENIYVQKIQQSIEKLEHTNEQVSIIGNLRSRDTVYANYNLQQLIDELIERKSYPKDVLTISADRKLEIHTDKEFFFNGLSFVIDNAIFYSQRSKISQGKVSIKTFHEEGRVYLNIYDNGPGIDPKNLKYLFDMFYIGDELSAGNGLGLFISKIAFEKLGINIEIRSKRGLFTMVAIELTQVLTSQNLRHEKKRISA